MLELDHNKITNVDSLTKCDFSKLKELKLDNNLIEDIQPLTKCNLNLLNILHLENNKGLLY